MKQRILTSIDDLETLFHQIQCKKILLVCDRAYPFGQIGEKINRLSVNRILFTNFQPNPHYESIVEGVRVFRENNCDGIFAIGGGSAIDVAKCIKLYSGMDLQLNFFQQPIVSNRIPLIAFPTTAGTGSEATRYAVIYYNGEKQSIFHESIIPGTVILDAVLLKTLPEYQRKSTMLDALCHGVESWWSINSTEKSRKDSEKSIRNILQYKDSYLANNEEGNVKMLWAAHTAGKAINIAETTAGHAMCYKLTSMYGIAHGHAAALCVEKLWPYMLEHMEECIDPRGKEFLWNVFQNLAFTFGCDKVYEAPDRFRQLLDSLQLNALPMQENDFMTLLASVNPERLKNNPIRLSKTALKELYHQIIN